MALSSTSKIDPALAAFMKFLARNPAIRARIRAPLDKTVVYSGTQQNHSGVLRAWQLLAAAKRREPVRFDYVTLEEQLRMIHAVSLGESLYDHAMRLGESLDKHGVGGQAMILWRALSGIYVSNATGKVRALILPDQSIGQSVFSLTEVNVLLRPDVLKKIQLDEAAMQDLRIFRTIVQASGVPNPIVIM